MGHIDLPTTPVILDSPATRAQTLYVRHAVYSHSVPFSPASVSPLFTSAILIAEVLVQITTVVIPAPPPPPPPPQCMVLGKGRHNHKSTTIQYTLHIKGLPGIIIHELGSRTGVTVFLIEHGILFLESSSSCFLFFLLLLLFLYKF